MRRTARIHSRRLGAIWLILFSCMVIFSPNVDARDVATFQPGEFIVQVQNDAGLQKLLDDFAPYQLQTVKCLSRRMNIWLLGYQTSAMKASDQHVLLEDVRSNSRVLKAQFNHQIQPRATFPNDPSFGLQWALNNTGQSGGTPDADIDAPEAWDLATGGSTPLGDQIVVAIIDGGFDLGHVDVTYFKNVLETPGNGIDDDGNGYVDDYDGWNVYNSNGDLPVDNHGQHVAGIAGATGNNATGIAGVNWGVAIMPIAGATSLESEALEAYGYVQAMRATYNETNGAAGAFVVSTNASFGVDFGDPADFPLWCAVYDSLGAVGVLSAGATANIGMDIDINLDVPTACASDYLIAVTNTTRTDARNTGAAWGLTTIDLGAPGTAIYSTLPGNFYGNMTGTSMATPQVAGAVALMYAGACPALIAQGKSDPAGVALLVKQAILDGTDPNASLAGQTVTGGRLNVYNSLLLLGEFNCGTRILHTAVGNTKDVINDYEVVCVIYADTTLNPATAELRSIINSSEQVESLLPTGNPDEYHAFIPAQSTGTAIDYWLTAADFRGDADTTETFSFRVIDYDVFVGPAMSATSGEQYASVEYDLTVTNNGVLDDEFGLTVSGNAWPTAIFDAGGTTPISTAGLLAPNGAVGIKVRVDIPQSLNGESDPAQIWATSMGDPSIANSAALTTTSLGGPLEIPFNDPFPSVPADVALWTTVSGVIISTGAYGEPSAPYSADFNGNPSGADTLISQRINLDGLSGLSVWYSYEQTGGGEGPDAGDDLFIEFYNNTGSWELLNQHFGADPSMTSFTRVILPLPATAYHGAFRLRIRNIATVGSYDDWFVDDVRLDYVAQASVTPGSMFKTVVKADSVSAAVTVTNAGSGWLDYTVVLAPAAPWLAVTPSSGSVAGGESDVLTVWLRTADLDTGLYSCDIEVHSNDPDPADNPRIVPVTLHVSQCACPYQCDFDGDGYRTALDLGALIDVLFAGATDVHDPLCLATRGDFDCDGFSTALDLGALIDHLFAGADGPCNPCGP